eukprot:994205-Rhodomonas_salina.1
MALAMNQKPISSLGRSTSRDASRDCCLDHQQLESGPWAPCHFSLQGGPPAGDLTGLVLR